ncbi:MAG: HTH-type transcriptional regulator CymR [Actinomycetota bacterium]
MRFTTLTDYGLRAMLEIAASQDEWVSIETVATSQSMSDDYLRTALNALKRAGLVESRKGRQGGFKLAKSADEIHLADVIRAIDGPLTSISGHRPEGVAYTGAASGLEKVWIALRAKERRILDNVSLQDVLDSKFPDFIQVLVDDPDSWGAPN